MPRRELDALRRHQVDERVVLRRRRAMHGLHHALVLLRAGDREHVGIARGDLFRFRAHAAGDDDLAVFRQGFADGAEQFRLRAVEKPAGIDDDEVGAVVLARELVAFRAQPRDDALGIDQRLGAAERNERYAGRSGHSRLFRGVRALGEPTAGVNQIEPASSAARAAKESPQKCRTSTNFTRRVRHLAPGVRGKLTISGSPDHVATRGEGSARKAGSAPTISGCWVQEHDKAGPNVAADPSGGRSDRSEPRCGLQLCRVRSGYDGLVQWLGQAGLGEAARNLSRQSSRPRRSKPW